MLTDLICYDLKVAALIAVFYLFYMLLLARETTHSLNRAVLLLAVVLSVVLPLCVVTVHETRFLPVGGGLSPLPPVSPAGGHDTPEEPVVRLDVLLAAVLLSGAVARLLYLAKGVWRLHQMIGGGESHTLPSGTRVCVVDAPIAPFSWLRTIVLQRADWNVSTGGAKRVESPALPPILAHEEAHVRHRHSYDVVVVEVLTALQWFNPVVWFLRQELRIVHEYEADASVLSCGFDESQYIHLLMQKATGMKACALANGIHTQKTKKRIIMMLKPKSRRTAWLKSLYVVPIALTSLAMTARTVVDYETSSAEDSAVRLIHEKTNGRGDSYQISYQPGVKFYNNGKEEAIPGNRSVALEVEKTTMMLNGVKFDETTLPQLPVAALREIHLNQTDPDRFVCNLTTAERVKYSPTMSDLEFVSYVKQQQAAGIDEKALDQMMLNEGGSISRPRILHVIRAYGSNKNKLFVVDGKEVTPEHFNELKPEAIASVTVMDVGPAKKAFGEKGRYGATVIETRQQQADDPVFDVVEQMPLFPGGDAGLMQFIARNIKYPAKAQEYGVQGRVLVKFIVEKDGRVSGPEIIEMPKSSGASMVTVTATMTEKQRKDAEGHNAGVQALRDEAIRVVNAMPRWTPARQNGLAVRCRYTIPVTYRLN